jgi:hypothetical protein
MTALSLILTSDAIFVVTMIRKYLFLKGCFVIAGSCSSVLTPRFMVLFFLLQNLAPPYSNDVRIRTGEDAHEALRERASSTHGSESVLCLCSAQEPL